MKRMKKDIRCFFALLAMLVYSGINAQQKQEISLKLDTTKIRIGEQIKLSVFAKTDTLSFIDFPELKNLGSFEVVKSSLPDTLQKKPLRLLEKNYYITAWDTGKFTIPPIKISIHDSIISTDSIPGIDVLGVKLDTINQPAYGFKNIMNIDGKDASTYKKPFFNYWWLLIFVLLAVLYFIYLKRKKIFPSKQVLTPFQKAMLEWQKLEKEALWNRNQVGKHYLKLTHLLKVYLENELHLSAKEKISSELLQDLKKFRFENGDYFPAGLLEKLQETLKRADLAKYANIAPTDEEIDRDMHVIKDFIESSHQVIQTIEEEKNKKMAEIKAAKRRKKRILYTTLGILLALILSIGGATYYFLHKYGILEQVQENISAPEWVYNEYGGIPAVGLTTPHILNSTDIREHLSDAEKIMLDKLPGEISVYTDENFLKGYAIIDMNIDFDKEIPQSDKLGPGMLNLLLTSIKAKNPKLEKDKTEEGIRYTGEFEAEIPKINITRKFDFIAQTYSGKNYVRLVLIAYKHGSKENKALADKVINSVELIKE